MRSFLCLSLAMLISFQMALCGRCPEMEGEDRTGQKHFELKFDAWHAASRSYGHSCASDVLLPVALQAGGRVSSRCSSQQNRRQNIELFLVVLTSRTGYGLKDTIIHDLCASPSEQGHHETLCFCGRRLFFRQSFERAGSIRPCHSSCSQSCTANTTTTAMS